MFLHDIKKCTNSFEIFTHGCGRGSPGLATWFLEGVGQMTMFDHDGGRGVKISENLTTWYMDAPIKTFPSFTLNKPAKL